jgi:hypothetical protein
MEVLDSQNDLSNVNSGSILTESSLSLENSSEVTTWTVIKNQEKFITCLESVVKIYYEGMLGV